MTSLPLIVDGIQCPRCNGESKVIDSRDGETSRRRRRECLSCKHRYSTYEIHAEEYERLQALKVNVKEIDAAIVTLNTIKTQLGATNGHREN